MRLILDTNLWSRLADQGEAKRFSDVAKERGIALLVPPTVLFELGRNSRADIRQRHLDGLLSAEILRLPGDGEVFAAELTREIARCRPDWMRARPDTSVEATWHTMWTKRVWRSAKEHPDRFYAAAGFGAEEHASNVAATQRFNRSAILRSETGLPSLTGWFVEPTAEITSYLRGGWPQGHRAEPWRAEILLGFWDIIVKVHNDITDRRRHTFAKLIGARVYLDRLTASPTEFCALFLHDIAAEHIPGIWANWAVDYLQPNRKVQASNAADSQHGTYLPYCDVFLTSDRAFFDVAAEARSHAPFPMCTVGRVPTTANPADDIVATLDCLDR